MATIFEKAFIKQLKECHLSFTTLLVALHYFVTIFLALPFTELQSCSASLAWVHSASTHHTTGCKQYKCWMAAAAQHPHLTDHPMTFSTTWRQVKIAVVLTESVTMAHILCHYRFGFYPCQFFNKYFLYSLLSEGYFDNYLNTVISNQWSCNNIFPVENQNLHSIIFTTLGLTQNSR